MERSERIAKMSGTVNLLNRARNAYYNLAKPFMTDEEYDKRFDELKQLEQELDYVLPDSPTKGVGYAVLDKLKKVSIDPPMLSLDKTQDIDEFKRFMNVSPSFLMLKMDGLSVRLTYKGGKLVAANTRGNGEVGEDILHTAKTFVNLPSSISKKDEIILDGEAIISYADFDRINEELSEAEKFANPRNLVSGSVRQLDANVCAERNVRFICWKAIKLPDDEDNFIDRLVAVERLGFEIVPLMYYNSAIAQAMINNLKEKAEKLGYPIDGIVGKYLSEKYGQNLGRTAHHELCGMAFKFKDEAVETTLRDIEWGCGKTENLTPVAIFDPVQIEGTTVSRASLHNLKRARELQIGIGDKIGVVKRNMIIPDVAENLTRSDTYKMPTNCPYCNGKLDNDGQDLFCTNSECSGKMVGLLSHFCGKLGMNIIGLSDATIERLFRSGYVKTFSDIYNLDFFVDEIARWDRFSKKSALKLLKSIEKSKDTDMASFISALSIPRIGKSQAKVLAGHFNYDPEALLNAATSGYNFASIDGFGEKIGDGIAKWFSNQRNITEFNTLLEILNIEVPVTAIAGDKLGGQTFCTTGKLNKFKNRDELVTSIENNGGTYASGVSRKLDYLICNEVSGSSKSKKATDLGVKVITEDEYLLMVGA